MCTHTRTAKTPTGSWKSVQCPGSRGRFPCQLQEPLHTGCYGKTPFCTVHRTSLLHNHNITSSTLHGKASPILWFISTFYCFQLSKIVILIKEGKLRQQVYMKVKRLMGNFFSAKPTAELAELERHQTTLKSKVGF